MSKAYEPRLKTKYREQIRTKLQDQFNYSNPMMIPKLDKVVINMGVGEAVADSKKIKSALAELERIAGQKPVATKARKSIAASSSAKAC
jgi:large subunit ribosomal protein L5